MTHREPSLQAGQFVYTTPDDPRAAPVIDGLRNEYASRYHALAGLAARSTEPNEMDKYASALFSPEAGGNFVLLIQDGQAIAGGAFKRHLDAGTAEIKRVWTHPERRRQGLAARVMHELEAQAVRQGYQRLYLTTGSRQPEAIQLYLGLGYTALEDVTALSTVRTGLPFVKRLVPQGAAG
ncbi:Acetyltransferase, N-acetylglutamate synthase [Cupriavidus necator]|uniref:Acetyltransferase, N-acetylglutamate synthase n=1 Tax=Cupriavidus necator TaxID=106590 RepID=A0A1K0IJN5_CUPNE|nr:Acetyltransferase, N-acetylglutamate synthase [Cupriavidus necator]